MDSFEVNVCRLCLKNVNDKKIYAIKDLIKEILEVLSSKLISDDSPMYLMCNACYTQLLEAFNFKSVCLDTEDTIFPYTCQERPQLNLRKIYAKEKANRQLIPLAKNKEICRLCMRPVIGTSMQDVDFHKAQIFLPEMNFSIIKDPVVCMQCRDSLEVHTNFLRNCLVLKVQLKSTGPTSNFVLKNDDVAIKFDETDLLETINEKQYVDNHSNERDSGASLVEKSKKLDDLSDRQNLENGEPNCTQTQPEENRSLREIRSAKCNDVISEVCKHNCNECDYKHEVNSKLKIHQLRHKDVSEVATYKCSKCNYQSKHKRCLKAHLLFHKVPGYNCDQCDFKSKFRANLKRHLLRHQDISQLPTYKCEECDYTSKFKHYVKMHQLRHKDVPEAQTYGCNDCDFKTRCKEHLKRHVKRHAGVCEQPILRFKCDQCDYKSNIKGNLKLHQMRHKDSSEVPMYVCDDCGFKSRHKKVTKLHQLRHRDFLEVAT